MTRAALYLTMTLLAHGLLVGCTPLPDIPPLPDTGQPAPALMPLDRLLTGVDRPRATAAASDALVARAARLRARAALMRGPVLDPETRKRLALAIANGRA